MRDRRHMRHPHECVGCRQREAANAGIDSEGIHDPPETVVRTHRTTLQLDLRSQTQPHHRDRPHYILCDVVVALTPMRSHDPRRQAAPHTASARCRCCQHTSGEANTQGASAMELAAALVV